MYIYIQGVLQMELTSTDILWHANAQFRSRGDVEEASLCSWLERGPGGGGRGGVSPGLPAKKRHCLDDF